MIVVELNMGPVRTSEAIVLAFEGRGREGTTIFRFRQLLQRTFDEVSLRL